MNKNRSGAYHLYANPLGVLRVIRLHQPDPQSTITEHTPHHPNNHKHDTTQKQSRSAGGRMHDNTWC